MKNPYKFFIEQVELKYGIRFKKAFGRPYNQEGIVRISVMLVMHRIAGFTITRITEYVKACEGGIQKALTRANGYLTTNDERFVYIYNDILAIHNRSLLNWVKASKVEHGEIIFDFEFGDFNPDLMNNWLTGW